MLPHQTPVNAHTPACTPGFPDAPDPRPAAQVRQDAAFAARRAAQLARAAAHTRTDLIDANSHGISDAGADVTLLDPAQATDYVTQLIDAARFQLLILVAALPNPESHAHRLLDGLLRAADRGVRITSVWTAEALTAAHAHAAADQLRNAGWMRQSSSIRMCMVAVDAQIAVLPVDANSPGRGALAIRSPALCQLLTELVRQIHRDAAPVITSAGPSTGRSRSRRAQVLALLNEGLTEDAIAARLRVNPRTVRRVVAHLRDELHVSTTFQLGVAACQHGLVPPRQEEADHHRQEQHQPRPQRHESRAESRRQERTMTSKEDHEAGRTGVFDLTFPSSTTHQS